MEIKAAEISAILKEQIANFGVETDVAEVGQVISVGDGVARIFGLDKDGERAWVRDRLLIERLLSMKLGAKLFVDATASIGLEPDHGLADKSDFASGSVDVGGKNSTNALGIV